MALPAIAFSFDENGDLETNLAAFQVRLAVSDQALATELGKSFSQIRNEPSAASGIWSALHNAVITSEAPIAEGAQAEPVAVAGLPPSGASQLLYLQAGFWRD